MAIANFIFHNVWTILLIALICGVALDFWIVDDGIACTVAFPFVVLFAWLSSSAMISKEVTEAQQSAQNEQLKNCVKFAERDAQSIWEYPQTGYRCPAMDGQPAIERWINK